MIDDDQSRMPIERRQFPSTAVLEWRVTQLEQSAKDMQRVMVDNKDEILAVIREHNGSVNRRLDDIVKGSGVRLDRVILAIAALAGVAGVIVGLVHK